MAETYFDGENELTVVRKGDEITYYLSDKLHRSDGPAYISCYVNGNIASEIYCIESKKHRLDGPAVICYNENGNIKIVEYWVNNKRHRLDGPAVIYFHENGNVILEEFWVNGKEIDQNQFDINFENWPLTSEEQTLLQMSV